MVLEGCDEAPADPLHTATEALKALYAEQYPPLPVVRDPEGGLLQHFLAPHGAIHSAEESAALRDISKLRFTVRFHDTNPEMYVEVIGREVSHTVRGMAAQRLFNALPVQHRLAFIRHADRQRPAEKIYDLMGDTQELLRLWGQNSASN